MRVTGTASDPRVVGKIEVIRGRYSFSGHQFDLEQGVISFNGPMMNPTLAIRAETKISDVTAGIAVGGTAQRPDIAFVSKIGRAHVLTPVPNAHLVCRLLLEKKKTSN